MPKISIVMSVYNGEKYLKESVESILKQTESDFEFIIINDGSTDNTLSLLKQFTLQDPRIKLVTRENRGLIYSLNEGISLAQSSYIARMDADDIAYPDRLEKQLAYMKAYNLVLCGTWAEAIDDVGKNIKEMNYPPKIETIERFALLHNPFIHPSVIFTKEIINKVGGYRNLFQHIEDYELWSRIIFGYPTGNIPEILLKYRMHINQVTKKHHTKMVLTGALVRVLALFRFLTSR
jgi:glycosyltransferase involved in cell wall biosynthesis